MLADWPVALLAARDAQTSDFHSVLLFFLEPPFSESETCDAGGISRLFYQDELYGIACILERHISRIAMGVQVENVEFA